VFTGRKGVGEGRRGLAYVEGGKFEKLRLGEAGGEGDGDAVVGVLEGGHFARGGPGKSRCERGRCRRCPGAEEGCPALVECRKEKWHDQDGEIQASHPDDLSLTGCCWCCS
jgi:hypothetical protein